MDPRDTQRQARALVASRRILARIRQDLANQDSLVSPTEEDRELLARDSEELLREDLRVFAEWHESLGTNPEDVLSEMRRRARQQAEGS